MADEREPIDLAELVSRRDDPVVLVDVRMLEGLRLGELELVAECLELDSIESVGEAIEGKLGDRMTSRGLRALAWVAARRGAGSGRPELEQLAGVPFEATERWEIRLRPVPPDPTEPGRARERRPAGRPRSSGSRS
jgi:hypothetical protein